MFRSCIRSFLSSFLFVTWCASTSSPTHSVFGGLLIVVFRFSRPRKIISSLHSSRLNEIYRLCLDIFRLCFSRNWTRKIEEHTSLLIFYFAHLFCLAFSCFQWEKFFEENDKISINFNSCKTKTEYLCGLCLGSHVEKLTIALVLPRFTVLWFVRFFRSKVWTVATNMERDEMVYVHKKMRVSYSPTFVWLKITK